MNLYGNVSYAQRRSPLEQGRQAFYSMQSELGRWLRSKKVAPTCSRMAG